MDVHDNMKALVPQPLHCTYEQITRRRLCDILDQFSAERLYPLPLFRHTETFIGDGFSTESVCSDARLCIRKLSFTRQSYKQDAALIHTADVMCFSFNMPFHTGLDGTIHIPL